MVDPRMYTSKRYSILVALSDILKNSLDGTEGFSNIYGNVQPNMAFWDEIKEYPAIRMSLGNETRLYQPGGFKERFLGINIWCYVESSESQQALESLIEDIETVIEKNGRLAYQDSSGATQLTQDMLVLGIDTDEGALAPLAAGTVSIQIRY